MKNSNKKSFLSVIFLLSLMFIFTNCQQDEAFIQELSELPKGAIIMTQGEFDALLKDIVFIGINTEHNVLSQKSGCEDNGEYWVKTEDKTVTLGNTSYRQVSYDRFKGCGQYLGSGTILLPIQ